MDVHLNQIKTKEKICVEIRDGNDEFCTKACAKNFDLVKAVGVLNLRNIVNLNWFVIY